MKGVGKWALLPVLASFLVGIAVGSLWLVPLVMSGFLLRSIVKRKNRKKRIVLGLPDAVDLATICIQAGLSLDESLARMSGGLRDCHPDLSDELYLARCEMRAGYSWDEALCHLSKRTGVGEIKTLVDELVQAGPLGVLRVLRAQSNSLHQRQAKAQAKEAEIRLVWVTLLFVAPSLLVALLGPAR
jgi:tight adherence protein C